MSAKITPNDFDTDSEQISTRFIDDPLSVSYLTDSDSSMLHASHRMNKSDSITVGEIEGSKWVQVHGKGNFMSSPRLKEYVEGCLCGQCSDVIVDLDCCPAMDSTFMGTLAGLASRLMELKHRLTVVGLSDRNRSSLVELGLDSVLEMEKEDGSSPWSARIDEIRKGLVEWNSENDAAAAAEEVLEAHRKLCEVDRSNHDKFDAVLNVLEQECASGEKS